MKSLTLVLFSFFTLHTYADSTHSSLTKLKSHGHSSTSINSQGFYVGLGTPISEDTTVQLKTGFGYKADVVGFNPVLTFEGGYSYIRSRALGYTTGLNYLLIDRETDTDPWTRHIRLQGNVTYGLNERLYTFGGLNLNYSDSRFDIGAGWQAGGAYQLMPRVSAKLAYTVTNNRSKRTIEPFNDLPGSTVDFQVSLLELSLIATL